MVKIALQLKATLDSVTNFRIESVENFIWYLKFDCSKCHTQSEKFHDVTLQELSSIAGSRGEANFLMKCKFCSQEGNLNIEPTKSPVTYTSEDSDNHAFKTIVTFDCRGIEPVDWQPGDGWTCQGLESGTKFPQIDLSENKEWMDYDEKGKQPVAINELEFRFVKMFSSFQAMSSTNPATSNIDQAYESSLDQLRSLLPNSNAQGMSDYDVVRSATDYIQTLVKDSVPNS